MSICSAVPVCIKAIPLTYQHSQSLSRFFGRQEEIARAAFDALGAEPRISHLPDVLRRGALAVLPLFPRRVSGPARFFLTALGMDMVAPRFGTRRLAEHFAALAAGADR